jgi:hypothetical protein
MIKLIHASLLIYYHFNLGLGRGGGGLDGSPLIVRLLSLNCCFPRIKYQLLSLPNLSLEIVEKLSIIHNLLSLKNIIHGRRMGESVGIATRGNAINIRHMNIQVIPV